ncbi:hypothetical protein CWO90_45960 [Bradyrhizobium sp. Leo121]|nr:hypothetical protein CWO90_45960 [Bradyrhizobium sp. Leo121]
MGFYPGFPSSIRHPPEDFTAILSEAFSPKLWDALDREHRSSLVEAEMLFARFRRMRPSERGGQPIDALVVRWSRVAEPILRLVLAALGASAEGRPLGQLIGITKKILDRDGIAWSAELRERFRFLPVALHELDRLDLVNKKGVNHSDGVKLTWAHVVDAHTSIHWVMRTLLEAAVGPASSE